MAVSWTHASRPIVSIMKCIQTSLVNVRNAPVPDERCCRAALINFLHMVSAGRYIKPVRCTKFRNATIFFSDISMQRGFGCPEPLKSKETSGWLASGSRCGCCAGGTDLVPFSAPPLSNLLPFAKLVGLAWSFSPEEELDLGLSGRTERSSPLSYFQLPTTTRSSQGVTSFPFAVYQSESTFGETSLSDCASTNARIWSAAKAATPSISLFASWWPSSSWRVASEISKEGA
mmetsp:Transcript_23375/g.65019  ORF Transcript_23375/g.65019 Transcript_23375/m.65019 type:complete len:231 (-) Transcript_23375:165-857(-)